MLLAELVNRTSPARATARTNFRARKMGTGATSKHNLRRREREKDLFSSEGHQIGRNEGRDLSLLSRAPCAATEGAKGACICICRSPDPLKRTCPNGNKEPPHTPAPARPVAPAAPKSPATPLATSWPVCRPLLPPYRLPCLKSSGFCLVDRAAARTTTCW